MVGVKKRYLDGFHAIENTLAHPQQGMILYICKKNTRIENLVQIARKNGVPVRRISKEEIQTIDVDLDIRGIVLGRPEGNGKALEVDLSAYCRRDFSSEQ